MTDRTLRFLGLAAAGAAMFGLSGPAAPAAYRAPVVSTSDGWLQGLLRPCGGAKFLGIPYAEPPVRRLRWRAPAPMRPWRGVRPASASAVQRARYMSLETIALLSHDPIISLSVVAA